jgi:phosphoribosyl-ATP pyrophosphohydrolase/phosphoribosyl-AMP cyclohydrolase
VQAVKALRLDCDGDTLLALVEPAGPACHTGERTCFHRGELTPAAPSEVLASLERTVRERARERPAGSYTVELLDDPQRIGEKVMEEAEEVVRAAREESAERVDEEAADVVYHLLVLLHSRGRSLADAERVLDERRG